MRIFLLFIAIFLGACAAPLPEQDTRELLTDGKTSIVVIRPRSGFGGLSCPKFSVDGSEAKSPLYGGSVKFFVQPGRRLVHTKNSFCFVPPLSLIVKTIEGETTYIKLTHTYSPKPGFIRGSMSDSPWVGLEVISAKEAESYLPR